MGLEPRVTGRIVYEPTDRHHCVVFFDRWSGRDGCIPHNHPAYWARSGTVLECDCGRTFVAQPWLPGECFCRWRRESRFARWRRQRRYSTIAPAARASVSPPGSSYEIALDDIGLTIGDSE